MVQVAMMTQPKLLACLLLMVLNLVQSIRGQDLLAALAGSCATLPGNALLKEKLKSAVAAESSGLNLNMWATIVDRDGIVCAVAFSGISRQSQWAASRLISANKASIANGLSLDSSSNSSASGRPNGLALSTANLYSAVQPGGPLYGLCEANPTNNAAAYKGPPSLFGRVADPLVGERIGGCITFGGGLALYKVVDGKRVAVGGIGVSGDTACADHRIAWRLRNLLGLDKLLTVGGVSGDGLHPDNIVYLGETEAPNGYKHPTCGTGTDDPADLPNVS